jgi:hypothetical protein
MSQFNDAKHAKLLTALGGGAYTGPRNINDMELAWLQAQVGVTANQLNDAWHDYWDQQVIAAGDFNGRAYNWLGGLTYTGSLNDRWLQYWLAP